MENPNPAPKSSLNLTLIFIVALALLAGLSAVYLLSSRGGNQGGGISSASRLCLWR